VADRVEDDVCHGGLVRVGVLDHFGPVAPPEDVVDSPVAVVESAGVAAVQVSHALVEVRLGRLHDEVEVVPHQAARVRLPAIALLDATEKAEQEPAVLVVVDDRHVVVAAGDNVVHSSGFEMAVRSAHAATLARDRRVRDRGH
jgi:hypothetical protein